MVVKAEKTIWKEVAYETATSKVIFVYKPNEYGGKIYIGTERWERKSLQCRWYLVDTIVPDPTKEQGVAWG